MTEVVCGNCRFAHVEPEYDGGKAVTWCRRTPPGPRRENWSIVQPEVDWCGEFREEYVHSANSLMASVNKLGHAQSKRPDA